MAEPTGYGSAIPLLDVVYENSTKPKNGNCLEQVTEHNTLDNHQAITMKIPVKVFDKEINAILDTGAEVTVIGEHVILSLPNKECLPIMPASRCLTAADYSEKIKTCGIIHTTITIGSFQFVWPVYIASIKDDMLLGCDIFEAFDMTLSIRDGLRIRNEWIPCDIIRMPDSIARVTLKETTTIPPNTEIITVGKVENVSQIDTRFGFVEPIEQLSTAEEGKYPIMIARTLVDPHVEGIPVRLLNTSDEPLEISSDYLLGEMVPVECLVEFGEEDKLDPFNEYHRTCRIHPTNLPQGNKIDISIRKLKGVQVEPPNIPTEFYPDNVDLDKTELEQSTVDGSARILAGNPSVPVHLEKLLIESCENLNNVHDRDTMRELLNKHEIIFAKNKMDLGNCSLLKHKIDTGFASPIRQPMRRTPKGFELEEEQYLKDQLESGVVIPSSSAWSSPVCLVRKKDGSVRWCVDYRKLNDVTVKDAYPLPRIDSCLDCLASAKLFSTLDLQSGYWQLQLEEKDRSKTAFITKYGLYEYTALPFGLCGAPSTFQRCMEMVLRGLQWKTLLIYLDDIIIISSNVEEHFKRLEEVFERLKEAGLKLKPSKCHLFKEEVLFLGHIVGKDGIKPNPELIESVKEWKTPQTTRHVQQFLGLANYYRRFIRNFSDIASPLSQLTKKDIPFIWTRECQEAMDFLKEALCSAPILAYPQPQGNYILDTDASNVGVGGVLSQIQEGQERVISYGSKKLDRAQQNYCVTRRELLAVVTFMTQFRHYLLGQKFTLRTDHGSLRWLCNFKNPGGQMARWLEILAQYDFEIVHRDGKKHQNADALSRADYEDDECKFYSPKVELSQLPCGGCVSCLKKHKSWAQFENEVNDTIPLSSVSRRPEERTTVKVDSNLCRRMTTRSNKPVQENLDHGTSLKETWFQKYTPDTLEKFQREDSDLGLLHIWHDMKQKPDRDEAASLKPALRKYWLNWENIVKQDGVLYKKWHFPDEEKAPCLQLLVPKVLQKEVLAYCHSSMFSAHLGMVKTKSRVKQRFYWYKLGADVESHIHKCPICTANMYPKKKPRAPLKDYRAGAPIDRIGIDVLGPLPTSNQGNSYLLVVGDYFTRWIEAYPMPDQQAETTANKLVYEFISRFGIPLEIHSDQGRNFESQLFQETCRLLEVKKTRSTPYRPQSNGLIERFNRTLGKMLRSFVDLNKLDWDIHVPLLTAAYRSTVHPATGFTPNKLMLGREVNLPIDILYPRPAPQELPEVHEYVLSLRNRMEECYDLARKCLKKAAERQDRDYDTRISENLYSPGDLVYKRSPIHKKLQRPWEGPLVIIKLLGGSIYRVSNKKKSQILHHDLLKPYTSEFVPKWAKRLKKQARNNCEPIPPKEPQTSVQNQQ